MLTNQKAASDPPWSASESDGFTLRSLEAAELARPTVESRLPQVICAKGDMDFPSFLKLVEKNKKQIQQSVTRNGGVLFRGFPIARPQQFQDTLQTLGLDLSPEYPLGTAPRTKVTNYVFTAREGANNFILGPHNEMSYLSMRPKWISFVCMQAPEVYGETPIFNCQTTFEDMDPEAKDFLSTEKIKYYRYMTKERTTFPLYSGAPWPQVFETEDKKEVDKVCKKYDVAYSWRPGDVLELETIAPAVVEHPETKAKCVNMNVCHWYQRVGNLKDFSDRGNNLANLYYLALAFVRQTLGTSSLRTRLANGKPIPLWVMRSLCDSLWRHSVMYRWRKGDILLIDNVLTMHGRLNVVPPREILASFGDMYHCP
ncbi:MAG: TauD/TfdA family dioxygenase [Elusimicrobia bacterium]|nr:TauD/TfdA family dioxygenase [Elusimicrobiota bacterium]